ncbi:MAG: YigZ family protein, partial [Clostridia bacterium]|nr:YigZ family protein [Clostridia bacterium]
MSNVDQTPAPVLYTTLEGVGKDEFEEKRSVFIGHAAHVETEEEAMAFIKQKQKAYADATHNVWAYRISGGT